ncbi:MAG: hypothetical protein NC124_09960 [Clostridium sp.]|nr:hypothetical protein [Clostridium sp.]
MKIKLLSCKKNIMVCLAFTVMVLSSITVMAATSYLSVSINKSGLTKSATASSESCISVGAIISKKNGDFLASGENGVYSKNGYHAKEVSYTGLSSAYQVYGYRARYKSNGDIDVSGTYKYY